MKTSDIIKTYGQPGDISNFKQVLLPFPLRIAWDLKTKVSKITVHKLEEAHVVAIFTELLQVYGYDKIVELGIDIFGGCFNFRKMRGGSDWSVHSWAIAIDLDPTRNQLKENSKTARFARPEYAQMIAIFEKHGWHSLGKEKNYDWMHFQAVNTL